MSHGYNCACTLCIVHHAPPPSAEQCSHWNEVDDPEMGISDLERCGKCDRCSDASEAAYERFVERFHEGIAHTVQREYEAAARQKRELDR